MANVFGVDRLTISEPREFEKGMKALAELDLDEDLKRELEQGELSYLKRMGEEGEMLNDPETLKRVVARHKALIEEAQNLWGR